jgi:hypothetical protein
MVRIGLIAGVAALAWAATASADIPPRPGEQEAAVAALIRNAGHACPRVTSLHYQTTGRGEAFSRAGLDPYVARCDNGKTYLVGVPPRRHPGPRPQPPSPSPRVEEITG